MIFSDPKKSKVDIVQASGRAMRNSDNKTCGFIILPIMIPKNTSLEDFNKTEEFKSIRRIITALSTQDERIVEYFKKRRKHKSYDDIIVYDLPEVKNFSYEDFKENFFIKTWESVGRANWITFEEAKKFVNKLRLKGTRGWRNFIKSGKKPYDLPSAPERVYKHSGWISWGDWLGTGYIASQKRQYLPFKQARKYARNLKLKTIRDWKKIGFANLPPDIPASPDNIYKNSGWTNWVDWLGTINKANPKIKYWPYKKARNFIIEKKFKNFQAFKDFKKTSQCPKEIPTTPYKIYKNNGWKNTFHWLGKEGETNFEKNKNFLEYNDAKNFLKKYKLNTRQKYVNFLNQNPIRKSNLPFKPDNTYKIEGKGISWSDFLS